MMRVIFKSDYLKIKNILKYLDKPSVNAICENAGVSEYEKQLLISLQQDKTRIETCFELNISECKYTQDMKKAVSKIKRYLI